MKNKSDTRSSFVINDGVGGYMTEFLVFGFGKCQKLGDNEENPCKYYVHVSTHVSVVQVSNREMSFPKTEIGF